MHEKFSEMVEICNQALGPVLVKATLFGSSTIVSGWERGRWRPAPARFSPFFTTISELGTGYQICGRILRTLAFSKWVLALIGGACKTSLAD